MMYRRGFGYDMMGGFGWFGALLMLLFCLLVLAGFVLLVVWAVRASSGNHLPNAGTDAGEAMSIARRRYANGEIDKQQYEDIIRTLGG